MVVSSEVHYGNEGEVERTSAEAPQTWPDSSGSLGFAGGRAA
jgi:hypothetical protein